MTIPWESVRKQLFSNPAVKAEYDRLAPEFEISTELIRARVRAGLTQAELAARMGTSQSAIARLESGHRGRDTNPARRRSLPTPPRAHQR